MVEISSCFFSKLGNFSDFFQDYVAEIPGLFKCGIFYDFFQNYVAEISGFFLI